MVNYLTVGVVTAGGRERGVPLLSRLWGLAEKRVLKYLELEKTHLISLPDFSLTFSIFPDFILTTLEFPDFSRFSM